MGKDWLGYGMQRIGSHRIWRRDKRHLMKGQLGYRIWDRAYGCFCELGGSMFWLPF